MAVELNEILDTEWRLREAMCVIERHGDHTVRRCSEHPHWYDGNGIVIHEPGDRSWSDWLGLFQSYFPDPPYGHVMMSMPDEPWAVELAKRARGDGCEVIDGRYLQASESMPVLDVPAGVRLVHVESEEDWQARMEFKLSASRDEPWYVSDENSLRYYEVKRVQAERVGIQWMQLCSEETGEVLAGLGAFLHGDVWRVQDVMTRADARRRGYGTFLVRYLVDWCLGVNGGRAVVLAAEGGDVGGWGAIEMYLKNGFVEVGREMWLQRFAL